MGQATGKFVKGARKALAIALCAAMAAPSLANNLVAGPVVGSTDFAMFGISGLRGTGVGTITVSGVTGTVTRAILVWHGVTNTTTPLARTGTIGSTNFTGTIIGQSDNNCWGRTESQAYQADVTAAITGNGTYNLSAMSNAPQFEPNGASLLVFFNDGNGSNNRDVAVFWGNDSNITNTYDAAGWSASLSGINYTSGTANTTLIVSDGQTPGGATTLTVNTGSVPLPNFQGNTLPLAPGSSVTTGGLWDHYTFDVTSFLTPGPNTLSMSAASPDAGDCVSLIGAVFDLPAGTVTPPVVTAPAQVPTLSAIGLSGTSLSAALWGIYAMRNRRRQGTTLPTVGKRDDTTTV